MSDAQARIQLCELRICDWVKEYNERVVFVKRGQSTSLATFQKWLCDEFLAPKTPEMVHAYMTQSKTDALDEISNWCDSHVIAQINICSGGIGKRRKSLHQRTHPLWPHGKSKQTHLMAKIIQRQAIDFYSHIMLFENDPEMTDAHRDQNHAQIRALSVDAVKAVLISAVPTTCLPSNQNPSSSSSSSSSNSSYDVASADDEEDDEDEEDGKRNSWVSELQVLREQVSTLMARLAVLENKHKDTGAKIVKQQDTVANMLAKLETTLVSKCEEIDNKYENKCVELRDSQGETENRVNVLLEQIARAAHSGGATSNFGGGGGAGNGGGGSRSSSLRHHRHRLTETTDDERSPPYSAYRYNGGGGYRSPRNRRRREPSYPPHSQNSQNQHHNQRREAQDHAPLTQPFVPSVHTRDLLSGDENFSTVEGEMTMTEIDEPSSRSRVLKPSDKQREQEQQQ